MSLGEFLLEIAKWLYGFWPVRIISENEQGVRFFCGRTTALLAPGLHFFIPFLGEIEVEEVKTRVETLDKQTISLKNGTNLCIRLSATYEVQDSKLMWEQIHEHESTVADQIRTAAGHIASMAESREDLGSGAEFATEVLGETAESLEDWGINLKDVGVITFAVVPALNLITGDSKEPD